MNNLDVICLRWDFPFLPYLQRLLSPRHMALPHCSVMGVEALLTLVPCTAGFKSCCPMRKNQDESSPLTRPNVHTPTPLASEWRQLLSATCVWNKLHFLSWRRVVKHLEWMEWLQMPRPRRAGTGLLSQGQGLVWKKGGSLETQSWEQAHARCTEDGWTQTNCLLKVAGTQWLGSLGMLSALGLSAISPLHNGCPFELGCNPRVTMVIIWES